MPSPELTDPAARRHLLIDIALRRACPGSSLELLRRRTWRQPVYPLKSLIGAPSLVVGGVATRMYAPERATDDLDVLVAADDAERFYRGLQDAGCHRLGSLTSPGSSWRLPDGTPLDVLESVT